MTPKRVHPKNNGKFRFLMPFHFSTCHIKNIIQNMKRRLLKLHKIMKNTKNGSVLTKPKKLQKICKELLVITQCKILLLCV